MPKKRFALLPSEREKECQHEHGAYSGTVPCTGPFRCRMCGEELPEPGKKEQHERA